MEQENTTAGLTNKATIISKVLNANTLSVALDELSLLEDCYLLASECANDVAEKEKLKQKFASLWQGLQQESIEIYVSNLIEQLIEPIKNTSSYKDEERRDNISKLFSAMVQNDPSTAINMTIDDSAASVTATVEQGILSAASQDESIPTIDAEEFIKSLLLTAEDSNENDPMEKLLSDMVGLDLSQLELNQEEQQLLSDIKLSKPDIDDLLPIIQSNQCLNFLKEIFPDEYKEDFTKLCDKLFSHLFSPANVAQNPTFQM